MYTFTVEAIGKDRQAAFDAYDATVLADGADFVVRVSVMEKGEPKRHYFSLTDYEIVTFSKQSGLNGGAK